MMNSACPMTGHSASVGSVAFSQDGKKIVSGADDHLIKIWNSKTGDEVHNPGRFNRCCDEFWAYFRGE
jgi:WD40 repeat protein